MNITPVKPASIAQMIDFKHGPFSNHVKFPKAARKMILERILEELKQYSPVIYVEQIKTIEQMLEGY